MFKSIYFGSVYKRKKGIWLFLVGEWTYIYCYNFLTEYYMVVLFINMVNFKKIMGFLKSNL